MYVQAKTVKQTARAVYLIKQKCNKEHESNPHALIKHKGKLQAMCPKSYPCRKTVLIIKYVWESVYTVYFEKKFFLSKCNKKTKLKKTKNCVRKTLIKNVSKKTLHKANLHKKNQVNPIVVFYGEVYRHTNVNNDVYININTGNILCPKIKLNDFFLNKKYQKIFCDG